MSNPHEELPKLAHRLGFANATIIDLRKQISALQLQAGKDAAYIAELEDENKKLKKKIEDPLAGMKLKKLAEEKLVMGYKSEIEAARKETKTARVARDAAFSELARLRKQMEEGVFTQNNDKP